MGNRALNTVKLLKGSNVPKPNANTIYSNQNSELFNLSHYPLEPAVPLEMDEDIIRDVYDEEKLDNISPYLLDLQEDEAGVLLQFMNRSERRNPDDWYAELVKQNFHFSDAPNNPFNKKFSYTVKELLNIGLLDELREDSYGNTHYKVNKIGRRILEIQEKLGHSSYFPLENDIEKEEFYYNPNFGGDLWKSLLDDITKERYRFPLPDGGFVTYQSSSEAHVFDLTKYAGGRKPRVIPDIPEPFTYNLRDGAPISERYIRAKYDFHENRENENPIDYPEFYRSFEKDWAGYELMDNSTQKQATKYQPKGHSTPLVNEKSMKKNLDFTARAMSQHMNKVLSQDFKTTELFPYYGEWYDDPYAWDEDGTMISLASRNPSTGETRQLSVPFNQFAKFYDNRKKYRFVDLQSSKPDEDGEIEETNHLAVFEDEKMVGLLPLGGYGYMPALRDDIVAYYATKYPSLNNVVASIHSSKRVGKTMKLARAK